MPAEEVNALKASDLTEEPLAAQEPTWKKGLKYAAIGTAVVVTCVAVCVAAYYGLPFYGLGTSTEHLPSLESTLGDTLTRTHLGPLTYFTDNEALDLGLHLTDEFIDDGFTGVGALLGNTATP